MKRGNKWTEYLDDVGGVDLSNVVEADFDWVKAALDDLLNRDKISIMDDQCLGISLLF